MTLPQDDEQLPESNKAGQNSSGSAQGDGKNKTAVICIHGVADQTEFKTAEYFAHGISDYCQTSEDNSAANGVDSNGFVVNVVRINNSLDTFGPEKEQSDTNTRERVKEAIEKDQYRSKDIAPRAKSLCKGASEESEFLEKSSEVNQFFTAKKLEGFEPEEDDRSYITKVVSTRVNEKETDFYEVHWADLSRVKNSSLQLLMSFYRLIFVLCRLCQNVKDFGSYHFDKMGGGFIFRFLNSVCTKLLATVIPALNFAVLATLASLTPFLLGLNDGTSNQKIISAFVCAAAVCGAVYTLFFATKRTWRESTQQADKLLRNITIGLIVYLAFAGFFLYSFKNGMPDKTRILATLVAWYGIYTVCIAKIGVVVNKQLGEKDTQYWYSGIGIALIGIQFLLFANTNLNSVPDNGLHGKFGLVYSILTIQYLLIGLFIAWSLWSICTLATLVWSMIIRFRWRLKRAIWTTQIANTCSGMFMAIATLCIWYAISTYAIYFLSTDLSLSEARQAVYVKDSDGFKHDESPLIVSPLKQTYTNWLDQKLESETNKQEKQKSSIGAVEARQIVIDVLMESYQKWVEAIGKTDGQQGTEGNSNASEIEISRIRQVVYQVLSEYYLFWVESIHKDEKPEEVKKASEYLTTISCAPMAFVFFSFLVLAIVAAVTLQPAVSAEIANPFVHPFREKEEGKSGKQTYCEDDSRNQGKSLSNAYSTIGKFARAMFLFSVIATLVSPVLVFLKIPYLLSISLTCISAATLLFVGVITKQIPYSAVLANVLDVASDVVNWLRLSPIRQNVTSKIYARYDGVLKHVSKQGYSHVVILAHSLGSLITVDLLRYWKYVQDGEAAENGFTPPPVPELLVGSSDKDQETTREDEKNRKPKIDLVTFGCPLNQLLGLRFTTLYGWCRSEEPNESDEKWPHHEDVCKLDQLQGIDTWTNLYSAGDYVGRHLWHDNLMETDDDSKVWVPTNDDITTEVNEENDRKEFCVGAGAHVHYGEHVPPAVNNFRTFVRSLI